MIDNEFEKILSDSVKEYGNDYESFDYTPHAFSAGFEKNMKHIMKTGKPHRTKIMRITSAIAAAAAMLIIGFAGFGIYHMINQNNIVSETSVSKSQSTAATSDASGTNNSQIFNEAAKSENAATDDEPQDTEDIAQEKYNTQTDNNGISYDEKKELSPLPAAEAPSVDSTVPNTVTLSSSGNIIALNQKQADEITSLALKLISDTERCSDLVLLDEDIKDISSTGFYITITGSDTAPLKITNEDGAVFYNKISILINKTTGYAIAVADNSENLFLITDLSDVYNTIETIIK